MPTLSLDYQITFFYTRDLAATAHFYENIMGLTLSRDQGDCRIYYVAEKAYIGFCERATAPEKPEGVIICFVTSDVDAWYESLKGKGVTIKKAPSVNLTYNIYHCFLRDPNGYLIEIQRFLDDKP